MYPRCNIILFVVKISLDGHTTYSLKKANKKGLRKVIYCTGYWDCLENKKKKVSCGFKQDQKILYAIRLLFFMSGLPNLTYGLSRTIPHLDHLSVDLTPHAWYHIMNWTVESVIQGGAPDATYSINFKEQGKEVLRYIRLEICENLFSTLFARVGLLKHLFTS